MNLILFLLLTEAKVLSIWPENTSQSVLTWTDGKLLKFLLHEINLAGSQCHTNSLKYTLFINLQIIPFYLPFIFFAESQLCERRTELALECCRYKSQIFILKLWFNGTQIFFLLKTDIVCQLAQNRSFFWNLHIFGTRHLRIYSRFSYNIYSLFAYNNDSFLI